MKLLKLSICTMLLSVIAFGQYYYGSNYWGNFMLEKGFEERNYFLDPHRVSTLTIENIGKYMLGLYPDSLSNISFNPANINRIEKNSFYISFANGKPHEPRYGRIYPAFDYALNSSFRPPDFMYSEDVELQPLLNLIGVIHPKGSRFRVGLSYELINYQGGYFENVAMRGGGIDMNEAMVDGGSEDSYMQPIIRQSGDDTKLETTHFLDIYGGYSLSKKIKLGGKFSLISNKIDGDYRNFYNNGQYDTYYSVNRYSNNEQRDHSLDQYEFTGGVSWLPAENLELGFSGGFILGDHDQTRTRLDSSRHSYENESDYYYYSKNYNFDSDDESWKHSGNSQFISTDGMYDMKDFQINWRAEFRQSNIDITNSGTSSDTTFYSYKYDDEDVSEYLWTNNYDDDRSGAGTIDAKKSLLALGLYYPLKNENSLTLGLSYTSFTKTKDIMEHAETSSLNYRNENSSYQNFWRLVDEEKTLTLTAEEKTDILRIPISLYLKTKIGLAFRATVTKWIYWRTMSEDILITYDSYHSIDSTASPIEKNEKQPELYMSTPIKRSSDDLTCNIGAEYDFSDRFCWYLLFNMDFQEEDYDSYYNDNDFPINFTKWKFGLSIKL